MLCGLPWARTPASRVSASSPFASIARLTDVLDVFASTARATSGKGACPMETLMVRALTKSWQHLRMSRPLAQTEAAATVFSHHDHGCAQATGDWVF